MSSVVIIVGLVYWLDGFSQPQQDAGLRKFHV
jgi:hypothetical protein